MSKKREKNASRGNMLVPFDKNLVSESLLGPVFGHLFWSTSTYRAHLLDQKRVPQRSQVKGIYLQNRSKINENQGFSTFSRPELRPWSQLTELRPWPEPETGLSWTWDTWVGPETGLGALRHLSWTWELTHYPIWAGAELVVDLRPVLDPTHDHSRPLSQLGAGSDLVSASQLLRTRSATLTFLNFEICTTVFDHEVAAS